MSTDDLEKLAVDSGEAGDPELARAFAALRDTSAADVASIDVSAAVMARVPRRSSALAYMRRLAPAVAAAVIVLFVGREVLWARAIHVVAPQGGFVWSGEAWEPFTGALSRRAPLRLESRAHPIEARARGWQATLEVDAEVTIASHDELILDRGALRLEARAETHLVAAQHDLFARGRLRLGRVTESSMKRNRMLAAGAAGVVAVLAVYAGYVRVGHDAKAERLEAPGAALLMASGETRVLPLDEAEAALSQAGRAPTERGAVGAASSDGLRTGGYWDAARRTVRFALAGEVFDAQTGRPIETFDLELAAVSVRSFDAPTRLTRRYEGQRDGQFTMDRLGLGEWRLTVRAPGYAPSRQLVRLGAVTDDPYLVVPLSQGGRLSGVVTDWRGEPLEAVSVKLGGCTGERCPAAQTDARGSFVLAGVPEEEAFSIFAQHPRYGVATMANLRVAPGETEHVQLQLSGILKVFGVVTRGPSREPAPGLTVRAGEATTLTGPDGTYTILVPFTDRAEVRVVTNAELPVELASYPESRSAEPIRWVRAPTHVAELHKDFALAVERARLSGRITDAAGAPVARAKLLLTNTMGWSKRDHETFPEASVTDDEGRYRIDDIPAHAGYSLSLERDGERVRLGAVSIDEPGEVTADFALAGSTLRGRFVERDTGEPFPVSNACTKFGAMSRSSGAIYLARCLDDGGFEIEDLPAGRYRLGHIAPKLFKELDFEARDVDVPARGAAPDVEVRVSGSRFVTFMARVTDTEGRFVPGLKLRYHVRHGSVTSGLQVSDEGIVGFSVPQTQAQVFIDAPGYAPFELDLEGRDAKTVIDVRLSRDE